MTFDPNIPLPGDFLADSQGDIKNNFTSINNSFGRNHTNFSVVTDAGKHKFVEMLNTDPVGAAPIPPLILGEGTLYTKSNAVPESQLFYTSDNAGKEYQLTRVLDSQYATFGTLVNDYTPEAGGGHVGSGYYAGWTFLAGQSPGLVQMYGRYNTSSMSTSGTVKWPITINELFSLQLTLIIDPPGSTQDRVLSFVRNSSSTTKFQWHLNNASDIYKGFWWTAIASVS